MKESAQNKSNCQDGTQMKKKSTQSSKSKSKDELLSNSTSSNVEEAEVEQWDWIDIKDSPFKAVGKEGNYTLVIAGMAAASEKFKSVEEATKYVKSKPWELILIASTVYRDAVKEAQERAKRGGE